MEEQKRPKISVKIGGHPYDLGAISPEYEEFIRKAADEVNKHISTYTRQFPDKTLREIVSLAALNVGISFVITKDKLEKLTGEIGDLSGELESYLDNNGKDSR